MNDTYGSEFRAGIQRSMSEPFKTYTRIERKSYDTPRGTTQKASYALLVQL